MHRPEYSVLRCNNVIPANPRTDSVAGLPMCNTLSNSLQQQFWGQIVMFQHWHTKTQKELAYMGVLRACMTKKDRNGTAKLEVGPGSRGRELP